MKKVISADVKVRSADNKNNKLLNGTYTIKTGINGKNLITTWNGSSNFLGKVQSWNDCNPTDPQFTNGQCKFEIEKLPNSDYYTIKTVTTDKNLITTWNGSSVQSWNDCNPTDPQFTNGQCKFKIEKTSK